jgi:hypothetical protein
MAQVVEYLSCKCKALSSNLSTRKKKKKKIGTIYKNYFSGRPLHQVQEN